MKLNTVIFLISSTFIHQVVNATCLTYISDEWQDTRYIVENISGDNVVTDINTGLMWKQCSEGQSGSDCMTGVGTEHSWQEALNLADTEIFASFTDWRVPNISELRSLVAFNCYNPAINETAFPNTPSEIFNEFWSSSPDAFISSRSLSLVFSKGAVSSGQRNLSSYEVRLVRSK